MDSPNRSRLVLAFVIITVCSVWLAIGRQGPLETKAASDEKVVDRVVTVSRVDPQPSEPARQSVSIGTRNRAAPVLGD
jgi:hypothetical protein